jgi:mono/diheme cytochrome c family protein
MARRLRTLLVALLGTIVLAGAYGCAASLAQPNALDARYASQHWPGTTLAELSQGRSLFVHTCAGCHSLKDPASHSPDEWRAEVTQMRGKPGVTLDDHQAELIIRYLSTISSRQHGQVAER